MPKISPEIKYLFPNLDQNAFEDELGCNVQPAGRLCLAIFEISPQETLIYRKSPIKNCGSCPILTELF